MRFFLGGYTADMDGAATGIGVLRAGGPHDVLAGGQLSTGPDAVNVGGSPSWIAWHPHHDVLYAALEGAGAVQAFRRTGEETFAPVGAAVAVGETVCHLAIEPGGRYLVASCWGDGRVVRVALDESGAPGRAVAAETEPDAEAAEPDDALAMLADAAPRAPRAHHARFVSERTLVTTDLGRDLVRIWHPSGAGLREAQRVSLPPGTGPRHSVWHPSGHLFVVTEASLEVFVLAPREGGWRVLGATALAAGSEPGRDHAAEITLDRYSEFVHVGLRGSDTIATLRVRGDGGTLAQVALVESGVAWPRHHAVVRDTLLVAGQHSHEVATMTLDERTGVPGRVRHRITVPSPSRILADRA